MKKFIGLLTLVVCLFGQLAHADIDYEQCNQWEIEIQLREVKINLAYAAYEAAEAALPLAEQILQERQEAFVLSVQVWSANPNEVTLDIKNTLQTQYQEARAKVDELRGIMLAELIRIMLHEMLIFDLRQQILDNCCGDDIPLIPMPDPMFP